jgi:tetratricopeptide (TPR) repeat protein
MMSRLGTRLFPLFAALLLPTTLFASDWSQAKGTCDEHFDKYEGADLATLKQCLMLWEAYKPTADIDNEDKRRLGPVLNHLYWSGDEEAKYYASQSMSRMQLQPSTAPAGGGAPAKKQYNSQKVEEKQKAERPKYRPREASKAERAAADKQVQMGLKEHKKGKYRKALEYFETALSKDPGSVAALYNFACASSLDGNKDDAVEHLQRLVDLGTKEATVKVKKARTDRDFDPIRDDPDFKRVTGFSRVKVVNGVGEYGEEEVERIIKTLQTLGYEVVQGGADKHDRSYPIVWYKKHSKHIAPVVEKALNHPKTRYQLIDWDSQFDLIVSWGDIIRKNKFGEPIVKSYGPKDPDDAEKKMEELAWEEDRALQEPDKVSRKVEHTAGAPGRTKMRVESGARRVEDTLKRGKGAVDKATGLFK